LLFIPDLKRQSMTDFFVIVIMVTAVFTCGVLLGERYRDW
jgi:hypothetical protein